MAAAVCDGRPPVHQSCGSDGRLGFLNCVLIVGRRAKGVDRGVWQRRRPPSLLRADHNKARISMTSDSRDEIFKQPCVRSAE